ncbi:hypothetical protein TNCT_83251 [Trichonephila clavata]|uniref:Tubuliform egg casing silk strands structural domain-containing protein n=1 Tax=Trichonephila clavata TaxID=2740835 RepID=A0A8X6JBS2_TRICU|nr:hypothetical protein TNCT_83251 [Trichonephila clavata]
MMFSKFTGIIIAFAILYPSPAIGGKECFWCNRETARNYVTCFITRLKEHAQFGIRPDILDDMQLSILAASDAITKTPDDLRIKIMNGALAGEISGLIVYLVGSLNQNADIMVGQATKLAGECYSSVTGMQHSIFSDNLGHMVIDMLDDSAPNSDYDVEPSYDYIAGSNNNGPRFDYSDQAPPEGNQPILPFNQQDSFLPQNRGPVSEYSQPQYFQAARPSLAVVKSAPSSGAFPHPLQLPSAQESFQYSPRQDIPREQTFQERPNQPSPIAPPPILEYGLVNPAISQQNNRVNGNQRTPNMDLRNQRNPTQNVPFNRQPFATENRPGNQAPQFNNGPNVNYNSGRDYGWVPDRLEPYNAAVPQANRFYNLPQNFNQNSGISTVGNQPDATQNFPGLLSQQRNRPLNNVPLNGKAQQPNQGFYNQPADSASVPIKNFGNNDAKQTGGIPQHGQNSEPQLAPQDSSLSTLSNDGERLQPNTEQQRFNPPPNNWFPLNNQNFPSSDDAPIRSQPSNSWFPNFNRNNPDSDEESSSIQTQNESENTKLPKYNWFPFFNRNKQESDSESEPTQVPIESRSTKAPAIQKPSKTLTTKKPIKQPNTKASTLQKITTSEMPKTTTPPKSRISPAKACAVEFGEEMFVKLLKGDEFYSIFDEDLTHDLAISVGSEVVKKAMQDYGLSKYANDAAKNCAREISLLPSAANSQAYAEKMAKSVMTIFYRNRLLKGNCKTEGGNVAENILNVLKIVASNSDTNGKIGQNNTPEDSPSNEDFKSSYEEETQPPSEETSVDSKLPNTVSTHKRLPPKLKLKSKIPSQQQGNSDMLSQSNATPSNLNLSPLQNPPSTLKDENTAVGITQKPNRLNLRPQKPPQDGRYSSRHIPIRPLPGNKNNVLPTKNTDTEVSAETIQETDQESPVNNSPPGKNQPLVSPKSGLLHKRPGLPDGSNDNVPQINGPNPDNIEKGVDATETSEVDEPTGEIDEASFESNQPSLISENRRYPLNKLENQFNNAPQSNDHLIPNNNDNSAATSDEGVPINNLPRRNNQPLPLPDNKGFLFDRPWNLNKNAPQSNDRLIPNNNDNAAATSDEGIPINNLPVRSNQPLPLPENRVIPFNNRPRNLNNNVPPTNNGQDFNSNDDTETTVFNEGNNTPNDTPSRQRGLFNFSLLKKLIGDSDNNNEDNPLSDNVSSFDNDNTDTTTAEVATLNGENPVNIPVNGPFIPSGNRYAFNRLGSLINSALQTGDDPTPENANTATAPDLGSSLNNPFNLQFPRSGNRRNPFNNRLGNQDKNVLQPIDGLIPANNENGAIAIAISDGGSSANDFPLGNNQPPILRNRGFPLYNEPGNNGPNINNNDDATLEPTISSEGNFPSNSQLRNNRPVRFPLLKKLGRDYDIDDKPSQIDDALSSNDDDVAATFDGKNPVNDQFNQPNPLSGNRRNPFNKLGNQNSDVPQSNDDLASDNKDGTVAAETASDSGNNPNDNTNVESAANGGNLVSNPFNRHLPLRGNRYPLNKFGDQDTNAPQTNYNLAPDNDGAVAAETASGRGNDPFNQPSPLPGNRRYPFFKPENQNSNVPESSLMPENDNTNAEPAGNPANNLFNRHLPLRGNRYPLNKFGDQDTNAPQTNDNLAPDNDGAVASEMASGRGNNPFNQLSPLPGNGRYPLNRPENQDRSVPESSSGLIPENDSTETEPVANGGNPTNPFNRQFPLPGNRRYPFSRNRNQDNNGESFLNAPESSDDLTSDNTEMTAATATTSDQGDSVSESPLGNKRPKILPRFKSPLSKSQKVNVDEVDESAPQNNDRQNSDKNMYTTPAAVEFDAGNDANKFPTNNNQPDNNNLAENKPVENDGSSNQPLTVNAPKIPDSAVEASSQTPKELNSGPGNQGEETENNERPDSLGKQHSKHKEKPGNDEKSTTRSKDNTRTTKPAVSLTTPVPIQSESPPDDGSEDKNSNSLLDTLSDSSAGNEIQFLMKSALESVSPDGFDYKKFTSAMTSVASDMKKQHPKWNSDVTLKKLYVSTIVALIQDMQNIATKPADYNIQPKPEPQPSSNSDSGSYSSKRQQSVVAASANSESSSYNPPTKDQTGTVLEATLSEPVPINNRPLDNYQNVEEMVHANSKNGPIQTNILPPSQNAGLNNVGFNNNFQPVQDFKRNYNNGGRIAPFSHPQIAGNNNANVGFKRNILPSNDYEYDYNSGGAIATSNFAQNAGNNNKNVGFDNNRPLNSNYDSGMEAVSTDYGKNVGFIQPSRNFNSNYNYGRVLPSGFAQNAGNNYGVGGFNNY